MRKVLLLSVLLVLVISSVNAVVPEPSLSDLEVTLLTQTPDPAQPGDLVKVKFRIANNGAETRNDVIFRLNPQFPFTFYGDTAERNLGKLRASSSGADSVTVEYTLKVDENAVQENAELEVQVSLGSGTIVYDDDEYTIDIRTQDAALDIASITVEPEQVPPGGTAKVQVVVKNQADSLLKDIKLALDFTDPLLPLAPYQSSSEKRLSNLGKGLQNSLSFSIIADPDSAGGLFKIPLNITFNDERGNEYSNQDVLAVLVGSPPAVKPFIRRSSVLQSGKDGVLTLAIANTGSTDVKFLELMILPSEDYELISTSDYFYIGDVDSDDTESEEINIYVNRRADELKFPVKLKYMDANNKPFQQQFDLELKLYSSGQLKRYGVVESGSGGFFILLIILAGGGFFYYKRYYKKGKKLNLPFLSKKNKKTSATGNTSQVMPEQQHKKK